MTRTRHSRRAIALAVGLLLAICSTTVVVAADGGRPTDGGRRNYDFAVADFFVTGVQECTDMSVTVRFHAGSQLQIPIGSGKPGSWSDTDVTLTLIQGECAANPGEVIAVIDGCQTVPPDMVTLERARVDTSFALTGTSNCDPGDGAVLADIDLTWTGNDDTAVSIGKNLENGVFHQERFETATVDGTVTITAPSMWSEPVVLGPANLTQATIATATEVDTLKP